MWKCCLVRKTKVVLAWCVTLVCIVSLNIYLNCDSVNKSRTSGRLRRIQIKNGRLSEERIDEAAKQEKLSEGERLSFKFQPKRNSEEEEHSERSNSAHENNNELTAKKDPKEDEELKKASSQGSDRSLRNQSAFNANRKSQNLYEPPSNEKQKKRLPQAIVIGTGKCGTRALLEYLGMHPYIVHAAREVHYFDRDENFDEGPEWYRAQMPLSYSNQITIEKSPAYVEHERSAPEIYKMDKAVKLLWVVKDPVVRMMSAVALQQSATPRHFYLERIDGSLSVKKYNNAVNRGKYVVHLKKWLKFFPLSQIHILDGGALKKDPISQVQKIETFLNLPPLLGPRNFYFNATKGFYCLVPFSASTPSCLGKTKGRKHPELNDTVKTLLYDFYKPYNEEFFKVLGRRFNWEPKDYT